jgi:hypothetical protein
MPELQVDSTFQGQDERSGDSFNQPYRVKLAVFELFLREKVGIDFFHLQSFEIVLSGGYRLLSLGLLSFLIAYIRCN